MAKTITTKEGSREYNNFVEEAPRETVMSKTITCNPTRAETNFIKE